MEIHHIGVVCRDLRGSVEHYRTLGFEVAKDLVTDKVRNLDYMFMVNGHVMVELIAKNQATEPSDVDGVLDTKWLSADRFYHMCFLSYDLERDIEKFKDQGYKLIKKPEVAVACDGHRVAFLLHPAFGLIEFLERP